MTIDGWTAPGFEGVRDRFEKNFADGLEVGAAFAAYHRGEKVVDLWGGIADEATEKPWAEDTVIVVFSTTKGAAAVCANQLAQEGRLDVDAPVADYWPEFAQARQGAHSGRLPALAPRRARVGGREAHARGRARVGPDDPRARAAGSRLGAGHGARLPRGHLRLPRRRSRAPDHRPQHRHLLPRRDRRAARSRLLDRPARSGRAARRPAHRWPQRGPRAETTTRRSTRKPWRSWPRSSVRSRSWARP